MEYKKAEQTAMLVLLCIAYKIGNSEVTVYHFVVCYFTTHEHLEKGYHIRRNGISNYTINKNSRIIFLGPIPDHTDDIKSTKDIPSWKRMCYCILKNDHTCRFMGFGLTRQEQKRVDIIRCKYGGMIDGK